MAGASMDDREFQIERLISRMLDDEATVSERREFDVVARSDPRAAALFEESRSLDREFGVALRAAMGRSVPLRRAQRWRAALRVIGVAAAACLALFAWKQPARPPSDGRQPQAASSWFGPDDAQADRFDPRSRLYDAPIEQRRKVDSEWIVIPAENPGEFMVISVDRIKTRASAKQRGF
ncbi:MAG: hypothetical protein JNG88_13715 [Phycisphaerales bacterium]|nr:hypothetical protein [Phycisphaerales bacterium]